MSRSITLWAIGLALAAVAPAAQALAQPTEYKEVQHPQPGEVKYADKWANVSDLFKQYKDAKQEFQTLLDQKKATNEQLSAIQKTLAGIEADYQKAATPIRQQQAQANAKIAQAQQYMAMRPPVQPVNQPDPPYPNRGLYRDDASYNNAVNNHQAYVDQVHRDNQTRQDNYRRQLDQYNTNQQQARRSWTNRRPPATVAPSNSSNSMPPERPRCRTRCLRSRKPPPIRPLRTRRP